MDQSSLKPRVFDTTDSTFVCVVNIHYMASGGR